jgi:hypothetical protein
MMDKTNKYIFTFGSGQLYAGFYQTIYANDPNTARGKMVELYGTKWSHQYTAKQWEEAVDNRFANERPLTDIYCD